MRGMKRIAGSVIAAAVVALGCTAGAPTVAAPDLKAVSVAERPVVAAGLGSDYYLRTVKSLLADVPHAPQPDADYIQGGRDICSQIDAGATWATFAGQIDEAGLDYDLHRAAVGAAIISFCPQHASAIG